MKNCMVNGSSCWYSLADGKKRKLPGTLELVTTEAGNLAGINSALANKIVQDGIQCGTIDGLTQYPIMRTEVRYGEEIVGLIYCLRVRIKPVLWRSKTLH